MRKCLTCGKALPADAHHARQYCNDKCRHPVIVLRKRLDRLKPTKAMYHTVCVICDGPLPEKRHPTCSVCSPECNLVRKRRYKRGRRLRARKARENGAAVPEAGPRIVREVRERQPRKSKPYTPKPKHFAACRVCGGDLPEDRHPRLSICSDKCRAKRKLEQVKEWQAKQPKKPKPKRAVKPKPKPRKVPEPRPTPPCVVCGEPVPEPPKGRDPRKTCSAKCLSIRLRQHRDSYQERNPVARRSEKQKAVEAAAAQEPDVQDVSEAFDGERVAHKKFGTGTVLETSGTMDRTKHLVLFDDPEYGEKLMLATFLEVVTNGDLR